MSVNPLKIVNNEMEPQLLLTAKAVVLGLICGKYFFKLSDHFLPVWPIFDYLGPPHVFEAVLKVLFIFGCAGILFNCRVRLCCIILGLVFLITPLSSMVSYRNAKVFTGFLLFMIGLHKKGEVPWLVQAQVIILYLGAGINKLFEPDWQTGQYFEHWMHNIIKNPYYINATMLLPPMMLSKIMCWLTIAVEFIFPITLWRRFHVSFFLWTGVLFHGMALILSGDDFGVFSIAVLCSYFSFVKWPELIRVSFNGDNLLHRIAKGIVNVFGFDNHFVWQEQAGGPLVATINSQTHTGTLAFKKMVLYLPIFYLAVAVLISLAPTAALKSKCALLLYVLIFPLPEVIGYLKRKREKA